MTTFVVLAAGRGSRLGRVGDDLHKCLIPLDGKAVLTRQFELAPPNAKLVVVTGYRADQVERFVRLAHPDLDVTFVKELNWGRGPGASLLTAQPEVGHDDVIWVACDTLWARDPLLWNTRTSWLGVAPIPAGTPAARWCRAVPSIDGRYVGAIDDKTPDFTPGSVASTAFGYVIGDDVDTFFTGLRDAETRSGEVQFSSGLDALLRAGQPLELRHIDWLDVGDESAYRSAQAVHGTYDSVKPGQATYVMPAQDRVVKFNADPVKIADRVARAKMMRGAVPQPLDSTADDMVAFEYVRGVTGYERMETAQSSTLITDQILAWWTMWFWQNHEHTVVPPNWYDLVMKFYRDKTFQRVASLPRELQGVALDAVTRVDWHALVEGAIPGIFHGDLTYANVIFTDATRTSELVGIDWREDFGGEVTCSDLRYDLGKLLGATRFHWGHAARGNFRHWPQGPINAEVIRWYARTWNLDTRQLGVIGALTLLNSAPLHAAPMDEILVTRGARWLGELT